MRGVTMKTALIVAGLSLRKTGKEPGFLVVMLGIALVFTMVFGSVFGSMASESKVSVAVTDLDNSDLSSSMIQSLRDSGVCDAVVLPEGDLYSSVREGKVSAGIVIPRGFETSLSSQEPLKVDVLSLSSSSGLSAVFGKTLERKVTEYLLAGEVKGLALDLAALSPQPLPVQADALVRQVVDEFTRRPALTVEVAGLAEGEGRQQDDAIGVPTLGTYLMFTMFTVIFASGDILKERQDGTWIRLMAAPVSRGGIVGGKILGAYAVGVFQLGVLLLSGRYLRDMDYGPNPFAFILVLAIFLLVVTGLGIMLSTMVKTLPQLQALSPIVIVASCMLGGCYWPLELVPPFMQTVAKFTPQAWAMSAMTGLVYGGADLQSVVPNILILLGFGALFFTVGVARVKFE
jgi:ABC-2 type transport system permease protein